MSCFSALDKKKARRKLQAQDTEDQARLSSLARRGKMPPLAGELAPNNINAAPTGQRVVMQDFVACVDDEVTVRRGEIVRELFRESDWTFVATNSGRNGFVPASYCRPVRPSVHRSASFSRPGMAPRSVSSSVSTLRYEVQSADRNFYSSRQQLYPTPGRSEPDGGEPDQWGTMTRRAGYEVDHCRRILDSCPPQTRDSVSSDPCQAPRPPPPRRNDSLPRRSQSFRGSSGTIRSRGVAALNVQSWSAGSGGHVTMVYKFEGNSKNELTVEKGETVAVLQRAKDWLLVRTRRGEEGYVPSCLTQPAAGPPEPPAVPARDQTSLTSNYSFCSGTDSATDTDSAIATGDEDTVSSLSRRSSISLGNADDLLSHTDSISKNSLSDDDEPDYDDPCSDPERDLKTPIPRESTVLKTDSRPRLQVLFDYTALIEGELDVQTGDIVFENPDKSKPGWAWVTRPKTGLAGFIPAAFTHPHGTEIDGRQVTAL